MARTSGIPLLKTWSGSSGSKGPAAWMSHKLRPMPRTNRRLLNFAAFLVCVGLLAYAYYSQYHLGLEPCPLCIFQRIAIALLGILFLIAGLHNPRRWGGLVYATLIGIAALTTIGIAVRHL